MKKEYVVLIVDSTKEIRQWKRGTYKETTKAIKLLPSNGWRLLCLMRWDKDHWTTIKPKP